MSFFFSCSSHTYSPHHPSPILLTSLQTLICRPTYNCSLHASSSNRRVFIIIHSLINSNKDRNSVSPATAGCGGDDFSWLSNQGGGCRGSISECLGAGEMKMESESTRRILATTNYISYGALQGNNVPRSQRGASYYNCRSGGQDNPYQRGCGTIIVNQVVKLILTSVVAVL